MVESLPNIERADYGKDKRLREMKRYDLLMNFTRVREYISSYKYLLKSEKAIDNHIPSQVDASVRSTTNTCRPSVVSPRRFLDDPHDDAHLEGENSTKRQKTSEYEAYVSGESSSGQVNKEERGPSTLGNQEQEDDYDFWTDSYASDDDEIPSKQVLQDIMEEVSLTIDEAINR
ncbi:hypothetical protein Tco_1562192 [Tanacetum coccineum]